MNKLKKGDEIIVITGKDKGKKGRILQFIENGSKLMIEGINVVKKHVKPNPDAGVQGGRVDKAMPIDRSNVMLVDPSTQKGSRVGIRILKDGQRVRYFKSSDQVVDVRE